MKSLPQTAESWFTPPRFCLLSACLIAACFPRVIAGVETFFFRDFAIFSYPLAAYHKESFWRGEIPLLNPYHDCGLPFVAQWNTLVFYPLSLIYLLFPLTWSLSFFCLFHMWLAAVGMFFLARAWTGSNFAAAVAGLGFILNGVVLSCLKWPNNMAALGWMPWLILFTDRALRGNWRNVAVAALIGATQMLAGAPEIIVLTWGFAGVLMISVVLEVRRNQGWVSGALSVGAKFFILVVLVTGLSAVQLLPFLDLLNHSQRDGGFQGALWPMPPWGWTNFFVPLFRMFPSYHDVHAQPGQYWISTYYVSIGIVLLAAIALAKVRTAHVWFLGGLLLFVIWMSMGEWGLLYKWLRATVPGLGMMRFPIKFIVLAAFILPILGAIGLAHLLRDQEKPPKPKIIWIPVLGILLLILSIITYSELNPFGLSRAFLTTWNGLWRMVFLVLCAASLVHLCRDQEKPRKPKTIWIPAWSIRLLILSIIVYSELNPFDLSGAVLTAWHELWRMMFLVFVVTSLVCLRRTAAARRLLAANVFLALIVIDGLTHTTWQNPTVAPWVYKGPAAEMDPKPTLGEGRAFLSPEAKERVDHLKVDRPEEDVLASRLSLFCNLNLLDGLPKVDGFYSIYPRALSLLQDQLYSGTNLPPVGLMDFLGVSQVTSSGTWNKWEHRPSALPLITAPPKVRVTDDALKILLSPEFDPRSEVLVPPDFGTAPTDNMTARIESPEWTPHRIRFKVEAATSAVIVISQAFYHCWKATMDGQPAEIFAANFAFQGLRVSPGSHTIVLEYRDSRFRFGMAISFITLGIVVILALLGGTKKQ